ncbi:DUF2474 domain-containing protein [Yersinia hibernica]|uniref:DUF2474 domain-containing protein n=1 Tax=Yersinia enterocolitica LC20 TaxID=1443113 RepID=A0A7U4GF02_YEREN|nr:DUF2474 domain-containing protein [Yersinia hibernica]AHM73591.1 DUF2474 domain-containing protein [Yersinia hibernica]OVZ91666.1 DUF2474 domain-containing protein [Yersinia kristensenii]
MIKSQPPAQTVEPIKSPWWKKVGWLLLIWCSSVLALLAVSQLFRMMMTAAGMKSH